MLPRRRRISNAAPPPRQFLDASGNPSRSSVWTGFELTPSTNLLHLRLEIGFL